MSLTVFNFKYHQVQIFTTFKFLQFQIYQLQLSSPVISSIFKFHLHTSSFKIQFQILSLTSYWISTFLLLQVSSSLIFNNLKFLQLQMFLTSNFISHNCFNFKFQLQISSISVIINFNFHNFQIYSTLNSSLQILTLYFTFRLHFYFFIASRFL